MTTMQKWLYGKHTWETVSSEDWHEQQAKTYMDHIGFWKTLINAHALQAVGDHKEINKKRRKRATDDCHDDVSRVHQRTWTWQRRLKRKRRTENCSNSCFVCSKPGHVATDCPEWGNKSIFPLAYWNQVEAEKRASVCLHTEEQPAQHGRWRHPTHTHTLWSGN